MNANFRHQLKTRFLLITALVFFSLSSCNPSFIKKTEKPEPDELLAQIPEESEWITESADFSLPNWIPGDYPRIAVLFGHGYTKEGDETTERQRIIDALENQFGLAENNGLILPFIFDKSYIDGKAIRLAFISELLAGYNLDGLVVVAAPERTHAALARLQDSGIAYPVYSVFPQDEILETEEASTFVLDYSNLVILSDADNSDAGFDMLEALTPEEQRSYTGDMAQVLISVIQTMKNRSRSAVEGETVASQMSAIVGSLQKEMIRQGVSCSVVPFIEPESGLRAQNHYVLIQ